MNSEKLYNPKLTSLNSQKWNLKYDFLINRENLSKEYYKNILACDLILKQNLTTIMQLPRIEKIVLNTTSKSYTNDKKFILFTLAALELISGQKPQLTYAQKSIANYKIRQHQILGCRVVLRENFMYTFLDKLSKIVFPRIRDYSKKKSVKQTSQNFKFSLRDESIKLSAHSFGFQNMMIFPELENNFDLVDNFRGMNFTFVLSNSNSITSSLLLSGFQLPVIKKKQP